MQPIPGVAQNNIEILSVVVVTQAFPARPSAGPDIRDFVRRQLARSPLSRDDIHALDQRVSEVLLEAAGGDGMIQVSLRIFDDRAEVDVLQTRHGEVTGNTAAISAPPARYSHSPSDRSSQRPPGGSRPAGRVTPRSDVAFPDWLADALRREGMTMEAAARQLKVSVKTVSRWVRGATEPRLCDLSRIRDVFGDLPFP
jgi:hypothetical protein